MLITKQPSLQLEQIIWLEKLLHSWKWIKPEWAVVFGMRGRKIYFSPIANSLQFDNGKSVMYLSAFQLSYSWECSYLFESEEDYIFIIGSCFCYSHPDRWKAPDWFRMHWAQELFSKVRRTWTGWFKRISQTRCKRVSRMERDLSKCSVICSCYIYLLSFNM